MSVTKRYLNPFLVVVGGILFLYFFSAIPAFASHVPNQVVLTVNGGSSAAILNGTPVDLGWYLDGHVSNCVISDGQNTFTVPVPTLPTSGTMQVTPPTNASISYSLTCTGGSAQPVIVTVDPIITITTSPAGTTTFDAVVGYARPLDVSWTSQLATRCSKVWFETVSNPGVPIFASSNSYVGLNGGNPYDLANNHITESGTFFIQCFNDVASTSAVAAVDIVLTNPPPPGSPNVTITSTLPGSDPVYFASPDPILGWAFANLQFTSANVSSCQYRAYQNGSLMSPNPSGYGQASALTSGNFTSITIATTTDFRIICSRPASTFNGVSYPATSSSDQITVVVNASSSAGRSSVPPAVVSITANPATSTKSAQTGLAVTQITMAAQNAQYCTITTKRLDNTSYTITGVSGGVIHAGSGTTTLNNVLISTSTRFVAYCSRPYDLLYSPPTSPQYLGAQAWATTTVVVLASTASSTAVKTNMYALAEELTGTEVFNTGTSKVCSGLITLNGSGYYQSCGTNRTTGVTFPFAHPLGGSGTYDIQVRYCDQNNGSSTFSLALNGTQIPGAIWTSNDPTSNSSSCVQSTQRIFKIPSVALNDGDQLRMTCVASGSERCRFNKVLFGTGDGGTVTIPYDPLVQPTTIDLAWTGDNLNPSDTCTNAVATPPGAQFSAVNNRINFVQNFQLSASTTVFSITCTRSLDGQADNSDVTVVVGNGGVPITSTSSISSGQCIDNDPASPTFGQSISFPPGQRKNPTTNYCEPSIDLAAGSLSMLTTGAIADAVLGMYDSIDALMVIDNLGPGDLYAGDQVSYRAQLQFGGVYQTTFGVNATMESTAGIGTFSSGIISPLTSSNWLGRAFDGVPFGTHTLLSRINMDAPGLPFPGYDTYPEADQNYPLNNARTTSITLPVPQPPLTLTSTQTLLRPGQAATVSWSAHTAYPLNCTVQGPGGVSDSFDASVNHPLTYANSASTGALYSTSKYLLSCREPITGTVFNQELTVEVVPASEEI
ncbi:MAG: hypothetical protein AAB388_03220 [Patescibacteria group bacterium]